MADAVQATESSSSTLSASEWAACDALVRWSLLEDLGTAGDITSQAVIPVEWQGAAAVVTRQDGVIAGLPLLPRILAHYLDYFQQHSVASARPEANARVDVLTDDGPVAEGVVIARLVGSLQVILAVERVALNFLGHLSGVATLTQHYVQAVARAGAKAKICDTRKTLPGWRHLDKYAVRVGGGINQRMGLYDAVLIKDNHIAGLAQRVPRPLATAVAKARAAVPMGTIVQIEIDSLTQLDEALQQAPDMILLDNMTPENLSLAVEIRDEKAPRVLLEASGGVNPRTVGPIAQSGVDRISIGALTHSASALDVALDYLDQDDTL